MNSRDRRSADRETRLSITPVTGITFKVQVDRWRWYRDRQRFSLETVYSELVSINALEHAVAVASRIAVGSAKVQARGRSQFDNDVRSTPEPPGGGYGGRSDRSTTLGKNSGRSYKRRPSEARS